MLLSPPLEHRREEWNARKDTQAVQSLVGGLLASHRASSANLSQDAESLDALCSDLAVRYAACGVDAPRGQEAAAGIDVHALLQAAESALRQSAKAAETGLFLDASVAHAALLASMDSEAARCLLEEPWLSYLAASVATVAHQEMTGQPSCRFAVVARKLAGAAALVSAAQQMEQGFQGYGPGESGGRAKARLRSELLEQQCISAVLSNATLTSSAACTEGDGSQTDVPADVEVAQRALTLCCRRLLEVMTDDLDACSTLLQHGALAELLRAAQAEGGAAAAGMSAALAALSASPEFAGALADMPPLQGCALVDLAAAEVQQLGPAIAVAGADAAGMAAPCFGALLNVCRSDAPPLLVHRLADRGIVGLLIDVIRNLEAPKVLRLETADALCRLIPLEDRLEASLPIAALQGIASPPVVMALVGLCSGAGSRRSTRGSFGSASEGPCEALRYRLPWLLAAVARIAATADLKAWTAEETGVRTLLVDGFSALRSREVQAWCLDVLAALCGRLAPDFFIAFLCRGPTALLDLWPMLLDSKVQYVRARAVIVGYYASSCLPIIPTSPDAKTRMEFLWVLPLRGVDCDFWSGTGAAGDAGRQLAEVAAAAAAVFAGEPSPPGLAWYSRIAICRVIASGLSALQLLNTPGEYQQQRPRAHREAVEVLLAWLQQVLSNFHEVLADVQTPTSPQGAALHPEAAALLADFLNGPLHPRGTSPTQKCDGDAGLDDKGADELLPDEVCAPAGDVLGSTAAGLRAEAARLLEALLFGQELYPGLETALSEEDGRLRAEKPSSTPASAPVALECAIRSLGQVEYGRWLTRLLIRTFSCIATPTAQTSAFSSVEESAKSVRLRPLGAFPCTSSTDATTVQWCALATTSGAAADLDALLLGKTDRESAERKQGVAIGGGRAQLNWAGNLLSRHKRRGLRIVLRFLDRVDGAAKCCGADRPLLAAAVLQRIAVNRQALGLESLLDVPTSGIAFGLAAQLLQPMTLALSCLDDGHGQAEVPSLKYLRPCIRLHRATVEAFVLPRILQQDISILAEAFAYLWALVHALGAARPLRELLVEPSGQQPESPACKACVELWWLVLDILTALLSERTMVQALCHSDDNAAVLAPIRQYLGKTIGVTPIFVSPSAYHASFKTADATSSNHIIDLHSESWCPPGRVLLAALVRLRSLAVRMSSPLPDAYDKFLAVTLDASVQVVEFVARPGNILHCSADVLALLAEAAAIITNPLKGDCKYLQEMQRRAATLLVTILHRPSMEALLQPESSLEALSKVPQGMSALRWCASPDSDVDLGSCGLHARALLRSLDDKSAALEEAGVFDDWCVSPDLKEEHSLEDMSALEEAGVLEEWIKEDLPIEMQHTEFSEFSEAQSETTMLDGGIIEIKQNDLQADAVGSNDEPSAGKRVDVELRAQGTARSNSASTQASSTLQDASSGDESPSNAQKCGKRFSMAVGVATQRYDPEERNALEKENCELKPAAGSEQDCQLATGCASRSKSGEDVCGVRKSNGRLSTAIGIASQTYDPQACPSKCDAQIGASEADIDNAEEEQLRAEVSELDNELGSLEAQLDAELHELEQDTDEEREDVYVGLGIGEVPTIDVDKLLHGDGDGEYSTGSEADDVLPTEAFEWLRALMAGEDGMASARDSVLGLLVRASQEQQSLSEFEAECLMEIYRHQAVQESDTLGAGAMRLALRYLYENVPSWTDNPATKLQATPGVASATGLELDGLFNSNGSKAESEAAQDGPKEEAKNAEGVSKEGATPAQDAPEDESKPIEAKFEEEYFDAEDGEEYTLTIDAGETDGQQIEEEENPSAELAGVIETGATDSVLLESMD